MYFIISPTKEMKLKDRAINKSVPLFINKSRALVERLTILSGDEIAQSMKVNEKIAILNKERYAKWRADKDGFCAIDTYSGLQFKQLDFDRYDQKMISYMNEHIRIISGLYGVLRPFDSIYPYRLEMQYKPFSLYEYWHESIQTYFQNQVVVNVASEEYSKVMDMEMYHVHFRLRKGGKLVTQSTQVKMARGKFIHFIIWNEIQNVESLKAFREDGYAFDKSLSSAKQLVFVKEN